MANPHNPTRSGELWNQTRLDIQLVEIEPLKDMAVISGGWAWHFMSPAGHLELKTSHDHKDVDMFVKPDSFSQLVQSIKDRGFEKAWTKYDNPSGNFIRYIKRSDAGKVVFDLYTGEVPKVLAGGFHVVQPKFLLKLYETTHSSKECTAVKAAQKLVDAGINPIGHTNLVGKIK